MIAAIAGVSHHTVADIRTNLERGGQIAHHAERVGADGVKQPASKEPPVTPEPADDTPDDTTDEPDDDTAVGPQRVLLGRQEPTTTPSGAPTSKRELERAHAHRRKVIDVVSTLSGMSRGLDYVDVNRARTVMPESELREWHRSLGASLSKLRVFRTDLRNGRS